MKEIMTEIKWIGDLQKDWRQHFSSLESIAEMTDLQALYVGSNNAVKELFPVQVLGHLPDLGALNLRNFKLDFTDFGGHLSGKTEAIRFEDVHLCGPWLSHFGSFSKLILVRLSDVTIDECGEEPVHASFEGLSFLEGISVLNCRVPENFFPTLAKYATNLEILTVDAPNGLTPRLLKMMCDRGKLNTLVLNAIGVNSDWVEAMTGCSTLRDVVISKTPDFKPNDLLPLAHLPNLSLRWARFEYKKESPETLREFKRKWNEIKKQKFGVEDQFNGY